MCVVESLPESVQDCISRRAWEDLFGRFQKDLPAMETFSPIVVPSGHRYPGYNSGLTEGTEDGAARCRDSN